MDNPWAEDQVNDLLKKHDEALKIIRDFCFAVMSGWPLKSAQVKGIMARAGTVLYNNASKSDWKGSG